MTNKQVHNWFFTINNPVETDDPKQWPSQYLVYQLEVGESGTPHYQGVVHFAESQRFAALKKMNSRAHWEPVRSLRHAIVYCTKEEGRLDGPWRQGICPKQGLRTDLARCMEDVRAKRTLHQLYDDHPSVMTRYGRGIKEYKRLCTPKRSSMTSCVVYYGETLMGKTTTLKEKYPDAYWHDGTQWFDDYDGQSVTIIDDFYGQVPIWKMLKMINHAPYRVQTKGGYVEFTSRLVVITTNIHPGDWYSDKVPIHVKEALCRRINHCWHRTDLADEWEDIVPIIPSY